MFAPSLLCSSWLVHRLFILAGSSLFTSSHLCWPNNQPHGRLSSRTPLTEAKRCLLRLAELKKEVEVARLKSEEAFERGLARGYNLGHRAGFAGQPANPPSS